MLTPWPPYPFDGGSKRIHSLCGLLRHRFRFSLLTFRPEIKDPAAAARDLRREQVFLRPIFERIHWMDALSGPGIERAGGAWLPKEARRFHVAAMAERLRAILAAHDADLLHVEFELMAAYASARPDIPCVLTQHDAGSISFFQSYFREMSGWGKFARIADWLRRIWFQRQMGSWFDRIVVMTGQDRRTLSRIIPSSKLRTVSTGVDLEHFLPDLPPAPRSAERLVYVGHYPHYPNEDAVVRFCRRIWPCIRERRPSVKFSIVGSKPTSALRAAAHGQPGVTITGMVADVKPYLAEATVFVAPIRLGRGIKGKILEAFAMGLPVVTTRRAAAGIAAQPGRDLLVADSDAAFADAVVRLLESPRLREEIGANGRRFVSGRYDWRRLSGELGQVYDELLARAQRDAKTASA